MKLRWMVPLAGLAALAGIALAASPARESIRRSPRKRPAETAELPVQRPPEREKVAAREEPPARRPPPEEPRGLGLWLFELPDDEFAKLIGTPELDRYLSLVVSSDPAGGGEFVERLNVRIRSVHRK